MALTNGERQIKFKSKLKRRVKGIFNFRCCSCFSNLDLEFAHKNPCLMGEGRGSTLRYRMIYNNLQDYILLCHECHLDYDSPKQYKTKSDSPTKESSTIDIIKIKLEYSKDIRGDIKNYYDKKVL